MTTFRERDELNEFRGGFPLTHVLEFFFLFLSKSFHKKRSRLVLVSSSDCPLILPQGARRSHARVERAQVMDLLQFPSDI